MIDDNESPADMVNRVVHTFVEIERGFGTHESKIQKLAEEFGAFLDAKACVMSTPIITNAGRHNDKPLSACAVPALDLAHNFEKAKSVIDKFHEDAMGTGFTLNDTDDPAEVLRALNAIAIAGANSGREDRPVGNMAVLTVHHPRIMDFIHSKTHSDELGEEWKFNISVDVSDEFIAAVREGRPYTLSDGTKLEATKVLRAIAKSAHRCGDPGLVFIERMNQDNPTPAVGRYVSTAPCGEVGLAPGETCQFGYINLGNFVKPNKSGVDYQSLERMTRLMTRVLDDYLEASIARYSQEENRIVMRMKRKIGIGICGLAEFLIKLRLPYASEDARASAQSVIAFINYVSKDESFVLASERGSCLAMINDPTCLYLEKPGFLERKYGSLQTSRITPIMWRSLGERIRNTRLLRNVSTIALPPTGRSGLVIDANPGVEPIFTLVENDEIHPLLQESLEAAGCATETILKEITLKGSVGHIAALPTSLRTLFATALEISPEDHLRMVEAIQKSVDESVSKTINMPHDTTPAVIAKTYLAAHEKGMKGITVFRTGSRTIQPRKLAKV